MAISFVKKNQEGQMVVETAILLPLVLFILFALINIGLYIRSHLEVSFASHQAVRVGVLTNDNAKILGEINSIMKNLRDYEDRTQVIIEPEKEEDRQRGDDLKVTVIYAYPMPVRFKMPFGIVDDFFDRDGLTVKGTAVSIMEHN